MKRRTFIQMCAAAAGAVAIPRQALARPRSAAGEAIAARRAAHNEAVLKGLFDLERPLRRWRHVVIHHTAAEHASLKGIDAYHRKRFDDPLGIEYHFLIGNGRKAPAGWIDVARWQHQARAIHLFKPEGAPEAIAICLTGNFEKRRPSAPELAAALDLTAALMKGCCIDVDHVTSHRRVDGRLTQCPGKLFPWKRFVAELSKRAGVPGVPRCPARGTPGKPSDSGGS